MVGKSLIAYYFHFSHYSLTLVPIPSLSFLYKMKFWKFYYAIYSLQEEFLSIWLWVNIMLYFTMFILYLAREQHRRTIAKVFFGVEQSDKDRIIRERTPFKPKLIYSDVLFFGIPHLNTVMALLYVVIFYRTIYTQTVIFTFTLWAAAGFSVTMGSHRLYAHKAFKASRTYQIVVMLLNCVVMQNSVIHWARDHRNHHKFVDTDADPYNAKRGLTFSHIGWLMTEKHPDVIKKGRTVDMSDLTSNPILAFQQRNFHILLPLFHFILPCIIPQLLWGERFLVACIGCVDFPWVVVLTLTSFVNSWNHWAGDRPYDKSITASDGGVIRNFFCWGEGFHNYHHAFPYDFRSNKKISCPSGYLIELCSQYGITWDLRKASPELIDKTIQRSAIAPESYEF